jgi:hypothetical protein
MTADDEQPAYTVVHDSYIEVFSLKILRFHS